MRYNYLKIIACLILALALISSGCTSEDDETVTIGIVQWDDSRATAAVFTYILDEGGYEYETVAADLGGLYQGTAQGDIDVLIQGWLPATQAPYWDRYGDQLNQAQIVASGAKTGLVVPEYVTIDSVEELRGNASQFDGRILGIEPGAGIMHSTEECIVEYELEGYELYSSSTVGMVTELQRKVNNDEWVVVTLWRPHWSFARIDGLKFLEEPRGIYGESDDLIILTRLGFEEDEPEFYQLIQNFEMDLDEIESIMIDIDRGMTPDEAGAQWIANNPEKLEEFLGTQ